VKRIEENNYTVPRMSHFHTHERIIFCVAAIKHITRHMAILEEKNDDSDSDSDSEDASSASNDATAAAAVAAAPTANDAEDRNNDPVVDVIVTTPAFCSRVIWKLRLHLKRPRHSSRRVVTQRKSKSVSNMQLMRCESIV
jgi:hypothetical protein